MNSAGRRPAAFTSVRHLGEKMPHMSDADRGGLHRLLKVEDGVVIFKRSPSSKGSEIVGQRPQLFDLITRFERELVGG